MSTRQTVITGADGYLGNLTCKEYLAKSDDNLLLWVRASSNEELKQKTDALVKRLPANAEQRVSIIGGDLRDGEPFSHIPTAEVQSIIHCAAVTRFNVEKDLAMSVNTIGTTKLLEFARQCPKLQSINLLSTVYSSGLKSGEIAELPFSGNDGFSNHYERSKWLAEQSMFESFADLPWNLLRVATAIADNEDGRVTQQNAFHNTMKLLFYGLLSIVPGRPEIPLYFITGQFAAKAIFEIATAARTQTIYNVCHTKGDCLTLNELLDVAFDCFAKDEVFAKRRIMRPLYADSDSFKSLAELNEQFGAGILKQALSSVVPFGDQLFVEKDILNQNVQRDLPSYSAPNAKVLVEKSCAHLIKQVWRRSELARK